jgi:hypothetical protein
MTLFRPLSILFTWEFGDDLGHIARLRPVAEELQRRGHDVVFAASRLKKIFALPASLTVIPAPGPLAEPVRDSIREPATFADILYNAGTAHGDLLSGIVRAWRGIFDLVKPDIVVQDYSPYALLALQGYQTRSLLLGTGFACPPDVCPLPDIRAWQNHYPDRLEVTEGQVLKALNVQLAKQDQPALTGIGELYTRVDGNLLATFPELDHYRERVDTATTPPDYVGVWSDLGGGRPCWPEGEGPRIFAYLKPFKAIHRLLDHLDNSGYPCLVYLSADFDVSRWQSDNLSIVDAPLDMSRVSRECDIAILHAGHGSTSSLLLAGKPILQLPFNVEQFHTAKNTVRIGAGAMAMIDDPTSIIRTFDRVAADSAMHKAAKSFAERYRDFDTTDALDKVVSQIESMAASA